MGLNKLILKAIDEVDQEREEKREGSRGIHNENVMIIMPEI